MPSVIVMGGSVGGLTAALLLRDAGCEVRVFERGGRSEADVCSSTGWIRFLRPDGGIQHEQRHRYLFSSWNTIYRSLLDLTAPGRYLLGREVTGFGHDRDRVSVTLADGSA